MPKRRPTVHQSEFGGAIHYRASHDRHSLNSSLVAECLVITGGSIAERLATLWTCATTTHPAARSSFEPAAVGLAVPRPTRLASGSRATLPLRLAPLHHPPSLRFADHPPSAPVATSQNVSVYRGWQKSGLASRPCDALCGYVRSSSPEDHLPVEPLSALARSLDRPLGTSAHRASFH